MLEAAWHGQEKGEEEGERGVDNGRGWFRKGTSQCSECRCFGSGSRGRKSELSSQAEVSREEKGGKDSAR